MASISIFNTKLIYNNPPGTDQHDPFLLDVINRQVDSLHSRLVIQEDSFGFGIFPDTAVQALDGIAVFGARFLFKPEPAPKYWSPTAYTNELKILNIDLDF